MQITLSRSKFVFQILSAPSVLSVLSILGTILSLFIGGCSTAPKSKSLIPPEELLATVCKIGKNTTSVSGRIWLKISSKEVAGQFPADIVVMSPDEMKLEIGNILGGTEARISIQGKKFEFIRGSESKASTTESLYGNWNGIPLGWATRLFLGRVPCPGLHKKWKLQTNLDGDLLVEGQNEKFRYQFRDIQGKKWPESLKWEKWETLGSPTAQVDFSFDDPDENTLSPKKWEARSSQGRLHVKWRERNVNNRTQ